MELVKIDTIKLNLKNPRKIDKAKLKNLKQSLQAFPEMIKLRPVIVDENNIVLGGNMRVAALRELNATDVYIERVVGLSEEQKKEFIVKDNLSYGEWDWDSFINDGWDIDTLIEWGLDFPLPSPSETDIVEDNFSGDPSIATDIYIKQGDVIEFINDERTHRLICGDSTDAETVAKLFKDSVPVLMVTDPPYGISYDPAWRETALGSGNRATGKVKNDDKIDWTDAYKLFPGNVIYLWHAGKYTAAISNHLTSIGFSIVSQIIWNKQHFVLSRGDYHGQHEPCWYAVRNGETHNWQGSRNQSTVWDIKNNDTLAKGDKEETFGHGTQKPVECMARPILNNSQMNDIIYDPFLGSGTTMVAADSLSRICYGIEIDEKYCQAIIERMRSIHKNIIITINGAVWAENKLK